MYKMYDFVFNNIPQTIKKNLTIIYGKNNIGKTYWLNSIFLQYADRFKLNKNKFAHIFLLKIDRIKINNDTKLIDLALHDNEEYFRFINDNDTDFVNKRIRDILLNKPVIFDFIDTQIKNLFIGHYNLHDFRKNSDGINNVVNILLSIIYSQIWNQLEILDSLSISLLQKVLKNESLILIDEIENFLHLSVQEKLLDLLIDLFPNVTFICTSHSALLMTRHKNADIIIMEEFDGEPILSCIDASEMYYMDINIALNDYFDVDKYPAEVNHFIDYFSKIRRREIKYDKEVFMRYKYDFQSNFQNIYNRYVHIILGIEVNNEV